MSCNGCRVLRRGCSEACILSPCLEWIDSPKAQGNATLFLAKFFGRSDLMAFIFAVHPNKRPGNWHVCQEAVETVLAGGILRPITTEVFNNGGGTRGKNDNPRNLFDDHTITEAHPAAYDEGIRIASPKKGRGGATSFGSSSIFDIAANFEGNSFSGFKRVIGVEPKLLNLFG